MGSEDDSAAAAAAVAAAAAAVAAAAAADDGGREFIMREEEAEGGVGGEKRFFGLLEPSCGCEKQQEKKGVESTGMDGTRVSRLLHLLPPLLLCLLAAVAVC